MDDKIEIRMGPLAVVKWAWWSFLFSAVGLAFLLPDPTTDTHAPISPGFGWFLGACGLFFAALAIRSYRWYRAGKVMLTLTQGGIQGRPTQDILVPWTRVTSVRRVTRRPSTFALDVQNVWLGFLVSTADPFRYDAYEVKLDWELATQKGVKGEHALGVGFDIIPAVVSFSSAQVAQAFSRWLPAERCLDFENRADPVDTVEFLERLVDTGRTVALGMDHSDALLAEAAAPVEGTGTASDFDGSNSDAAAP